MLRQRWRRGQRDEKANDSNWVMPIMKKPNLAKIGKMVAGDKAPKPSVSLAKIGKQTQAIHDELHGRKPKK